MRHLILIQLMAFVVVYIQYKNPLFKTDRQIRALIEYVGE